MQRFLDLTVSAVLLAGLYATMAYGLGLIYGVMRIVNLAHGAVLMLAAYGAYSVNAAWGLDPLLSAPIVVPVAYLAGLGLYQGLVRHVVAGPPMASMLLLFGVALCARNAAYLIWTGDDRGAVVQHALTTIDVGVPVPLTRVIVFGVALAATAGLWALFRFTHFGRALRAVAQDPFAAELSAISVRRVSARAFGLGTAVGALGGVLLASLYVVNPEFGSGFLLKSFCIIVLGGMDSMLGIFGGAVLLGLAETAAGVYGAAALQDAVAFVLLVKALVVRPGGLPSLLRGRT